MNEHGRTLLHKTVEFSIFWLAHNKKAQEPTRFDHDTFRTTVLHNYRIAL